MNHGTIVRVKKEHASLTIRLAEPGDARAIAEMSRDHIESGLGWRYDPAHIVRAMHRRESVVLVASGRPTYVARERPIDCAGSYKVESLGISLCDKVEGADFTAIVGLPLIRVCQLLRNAGFEVP